MCARVLFTLSSVGFSLCLSPRWPEQQKCVKNLRSRLCNLLWFTLKFIQLIFERRKVCMSWWAGALLPCATAFSLRFSFFSEYRNEMALLYSAFYVTCDNFVLCIMVDGSRKPSTDPFWIKSNPLNMQIFKCFPLYVKYRTYSTYSRCCCSFFYSCWHLLVFHFHFFRAIARSDFHFYRKTEFSVFFGVTRDREWDRDKREKIWMTFSKWLRSERRAQVHILIKTLCAAWMYRFVVESCVCLNATCI